MTDSTEILELVPTRDRSGGIVWTFPESKPADVSITATGDLINERGAVLSAVPRERMAAGANWDRIIRTIQEQEAGKRTGEEVVVRPGGGLDLVPQGAASQELSRVPKDRMAASPSATDTRQIARFDPTGVEEWTFIDDHVLPGYSFTMRPISTRFQFFTFRWNSGRWYLSPLAPAFDTLMGHETHVISLAIAGDRVPIVCKAPNDFDHRDLVEVRGTAGKFATYHSLRTAGHIPFSA